MEIRWLRSAVEDLKRLEAFMMSNNPSASAVMASKIKAAVTHLGLQPELGRPVDDPPGFRDWVILFGAGSYVLRYRIMTEAIYIVSIRHGREKGFN